MAPSPISQRRTHNLLLLQKLLNLRDGASPFTLVLDSLEQSAQPIVREFTLRAKISKTKVILISYQTLRKPNLVDVFVRAGGKSLQALHAEIAGHVPSVPMSGGGGGGVANTGRVLLIFDTLHPLCSTNPSNLAPFLSTLLSPVTSVLAIYHTDIPLSPISPPDAPSSSSPYSPSPFQTLFYLATAILKVSRFSHVLAAKQARDKSQTEPGFGLSEGREGILVGLGGTKEVYPGVVVEMELRRKSGRGVREVFVISPSSTSGPFQASATHVGGQSRSGSSSLAAVQLLDDHPLFSKPVEVGVKVGPEQGEGGEEAETTFSLGLTEKQRRDRDGIVLPYFDAQSGDGPGEGGRILYEMGREDDFDEDEDDEFA